MTKRIHNFNAGPAALPVAVLEQVQRELLDFQGTGMSIMEMSHRGKVYEAVHNQTVADIKKLLGLGDNHSVLFMGGGGRTQFAVLAMNLLHAGEFAEYTVTGTWSETAFKEAKKLGDARSVWSSEKENHMPQPGDASLKINPKAAYFHYTSNETIHGTEWHHIPEGGNVPLVCDMSSDFLSRPVEATRFGVIYAGAQKNVGPAGVTIVIVRKDLLSRSRPELPDMLSWAKIEKENSLLNTPPAFNIYVVGLVAKHLLEHGGLAGIEAHNKKKAELLYQAIDNSGGFYRPHAKPNSRSFMNVTYRLPAVELEEKFASEAKKAGMEGLKGHRSVGGIRASIYNAVSLESVQALVSFMDEFKKKNG